MTDEARTDSDLMRVLRAFEADPNRVNAKVLYLLAKRAYEDALTVPDLRRPATAAAARSGTYVREHGRRGSVALQVIAQLERQGAQSVDQSSSPSSSR